MPHIRYPSITYPVMREYRQGISITQVIFLVSCIYATQDTYHVLLFWYYATQATISELRRKGRRQPSHVSWIYATQAILFLPCPILHAALMPERPRSPAYMTFKRELT